MCHRAPDLTSDLLATLHRRQEAAIAGGDAFLRSWRREERSLVLAGDHADTYRLGWENDASWRGRERWCQQVAVELRSLD